MSERIKSAESPKADPRQRVIGATMAIVYLGGVVVTAWMLGPRVQEPGPLAGIVAVPAVAGLVAGIPNVWRNPTRLIALWQLAVLPVIAALTFGGMGIVLALSIAELNGN